MSSEEIVKLLRRCMFSDTLLQMAANKIEELEIVANLQKKEIERLHNILLSFTNEVHTWSNKKGYDTTELSLIPILNEAENVRETIKAEAVKEFAGRAKEKMLDFAKIEINDHTYYLIGDCFFDNLIKEKVDD